MDRERFLEALQKGGRVYIEFDSLNDIPGWGELLDSLSGRDELHIGDLITLLTTCKVELKSGTTVEPLSLDDAYDITSFLLQKERSEVIRLWFDSSFDDLGRFEVQAGAVEPGEGDDGRTILSDEEIDRLLTAIASGEQEESQLPEREPSPLAQSLLELSSVKSVDFSWQGAYRSFRRRYLHLDPPWKAYDIPCGSIGWRMDGGEDYMAEWFQFIEDLTLWERERYFAHHHPPEEWQEWLEEVLVHLE